MIEAIVLSIVLQAQLGARLPASCNALPATPTITNYRPIVLETGKPLVLVTGQPWILSVDATKSDQPRESVEEGSTATPACTTAGVAFAKPVAFSKPVGFQLTRRCSR